MIRSALATTLVLGLSSALSAAEPVTNLKIGDPERRELSMPLAIDTVIDTRGGENITVTEAVARLADTNVLFFGENHTDMDFHTAQLQLIRALHRAGREVFIGLEMFPYTRQADLNRWTAGEFSEAEFLEVADWYGSWGYRWEYYADIFRYARDNKLPMYGINAPRDVIKAVRTDGFEGLTDEDLEHLPTSVDTSDDEHRELFRAYFEDDDSLHMAISDEQWEGMFRAQNTWDAVMGWNAAQAVRRNGSPETIIVVLIGAGHVTYGLGAERQIRPRYDGGIASIVPVQVLDADGVAVEKVSASYADFVWGLPPAMPPRFPDLGVSLAGKLGSFPNKIIQVSENSVAEAAGLAVGDRLMSIGGMAVDSLGTLRKAMANYNWGDSAEVQLVRDEEKFSQTVVFRRNAD
jgi:uncharacterized iron-regulated protein